MRSIKEENGRSLSRSEPVRRGRRVLATKQPLIFFAEVLHPWEKDHLKKSLAGRGRLEFATGPVQDLEREYRDAEVLSIFIKSKVDRKLIAESPNLRFVTTRSTGYDHIDLKAAKEKGVQVANVPTYGENTVAEHTFALILSLARRLKKAYLKTLSNDFSIEGLMGFDLKGKTLGVIGTGHIGLHVIRIGAGFGMNVIAHDTREQKFLPEVLNFKYVSFDELLAQSDILSLHVPSLPSTYHLINIATMKKIKRGAVLINTSRGNLIETDALIQALDQGILSGAGLDVLEEEELILEEKRLLAEQESQEEWKKLTTTVRNHMLLHRENVIFTPHMAFYSKEAVLRILDTTVENIESYFAGKPVNLIR